MITDADAFETADEAIEYAHANVSDTPLDEADEAALREELAMLDAVLDWQAAREDREVVARHTAIETALDHDHFDAPEHDRKGARYLDESGSLVVLDGAYWVDAAIVTHYHYIVIGASGEPDRPTEARETLPDDEGTHWMGVDELDDHLDDGTLRPAKAFAVDEESPDASALAAVAGSLGIYWAAGCSAPEALDHLFCDGGPAGAENAGPYSQSEWAQRRDVAQPSVSGNVAAAREQLDG